MSVGPAQHSISGADEVVEQAIEHLARLLADHHSDAKSRAALETLRRAWGTARVRAETDALTQLPNRACFERCLEVAVNHAREHRSRVALMFLDLDGFKTVNDRLGHQAGDCLLNHVAKRVVASVRDQDLVARYGGDEFVVLLEESSTGDMARAIAERIVNAVSQPYSLDCETLELSVSVGLAIFPEHAQTASDLVQHADLAMYRAKHRSELHYLMYDTSLERGDSGSGVRPFAGLPPPQAAAAKGQPSGS
jgi:diguanylate cyclase (GGDEF)-like protein